MKLSILAIAALVISSSISAALASSEAECTPPLSHPQYLQLLSEYQQSADQKLSSTWQIEDRIATEVLCSVFTPRYIPELKDVEAGTLSPDPIPYFKLAQVLQTRWENRYLLHVVAGQRHTLDTANEGAAALLLGSVGLAVFKEPKEVGLLFTLFRHLFPVIFPSVATTTAKLWDKSGTIDGYPVAPAHIMTKVSVNAESEKIDPYETWRTVVSGTARLAGAQLAIALVSYLEIGAVAMGPFSVNPVMLASAILSGAAGYAGGKAVDEVEYIKLKNKMIVAKESILCDVANGDDNQTYEDSLAYYKAALALSSYLDRPAMDAWNGYQKSLAQVNSAHHIPFYSETSPEHALQVYNKKLMKIERDRDQDIVEAVARFQVLNLLSNVATTAEIPALIAQLPPANQAIAKRIMDTAPLDVPKAFPYYISSLMDDQTASLSKEFQDNVMPKDPDMVLSESVEFLKSVHSPVVSDTIDNLTNAMNSKFLTTWAIAK